MEKDYMAFPWSDNWQIEDDKAWFVSGMHNILFCLNLITNECESAVSIPEETSSKMRLTPYCLKVGDDIFCMPDVGRAIWIYDVKKNSFSKIMFDNPDNIRLGMYDFWVHGNKLLVVSNGLSRIIEIDIVKKKVVNCYVLCEKGGIRKSINTGTDIYSLSSLFHEVYRFDLITKKVTIYKLPDVGRKFFTFCFDGEQFWFSGYCKEVYVWNKEKNTIKTMDSFPEEFGIYNFSKDTNGETDCTMNEYELPAFLYSAAVGRNVWFIPYQTNKIIYVDKENDIVNVFEIKEENETKQSLLSRTVLWSKYILEYVRENRYIGLFSLKNNCILEVDTLEKKAEFKKYIVSDKCIQEIVHMYAGSIWNEDRFTREVFKTALLNCGKEEKSRISGDTGLKIYEEMLKL